MKNHLLSLLVFALSLFSCKPTELLECQVLVIGGGASGTPAAIQAARGGADVILVEETDWLGGMLTAAGVSATDGNHRLPSGLWGEFRENLYQHYGGPELVSTGWVSHTLFEPQVGNQIWTRMTDSEPKLRRLHGYHLTEILLEGNRVTGARFKHRKGKKLEIQAEVAIEATELGDVLYQAGARYFTGFDTEEEAHDENIQDLTYAAILKDFGPEQDKTIPKPVNYNPDLYECICKEVCPVDSASLLSCAEMMEYAHLPGDKYLLNWPRNGNDYFLNAIEMDYEEREKAYQAPKDKTLGLIYFLQTEAGFSHLGLAEGEFPTEDHLPLIPYHRESRRVKGRIRLEVADILDPYQDPSRPLYRRAIAVGDYPLDLHHLEKSNVPKEEFPPIPSFSIPYDVMIPEQIQGLLVAEKSISVSHQVNGATRLQPVTILLGQAAGAAAALSVKENILPRDLSVTNLQKNLLDAGCWLMPYLDITPNDTFFQSVQRVGVAGWMKGKGIPVAWANETRFYPDSCVLESVFDQAILRAKSYPEVLPSLPQMRTTKCISWSEAIFKLWQRTQSQTNVDPIFRENTTGLLLTQAIEFFQDQNLIERKPSYEMDRPLKRWELAVWLDKLFQPHGGS